MLVGVLLVGVLVDFLLVDVLLVQFEIEVDEIKLIGLQKMIACIDRVRSAGWQSDLLMGKRSRD